MGEECVPFGSRRRSSLQWVEEVDDDARVLVTDDSDASATRIS